tara:strand:- start:53 stop:190 length:138 start_codon:yes stop_codon:yes gene_type:complete
MESRTVTKQALIVAEQIVLHVPPAMTASKMAQRQAWIAADHALHV